MMRLSFPMQGTIPAPERLFLRKGRWRRISLAVRYGVFERAGHAPILIDGGWAQYRAGDGVAFRLYDWLMPARIDPNSAEITVEPERVLLSHLHADHVGVLRDLPAGVAIHADQGAWKRAKMRSWGAKRHGVFPELLPDREIQDFAGSPELKLPHGLGRGHDILGDGTVLSVPLPGHADGHTGFLFPLFETPVLYAADLQWMLAALEPERDPTGPVRRVYFEPAKVRDSIQRVRNFARAGGIVVLNHDPEPVGPFTA